MVALARETVPRERANLTWTEPTPSPPAASAASPPWQPCSPPWANALDGGSAERRAFRFALLDRRGDLAATGIGELYAAEQLLDETTDGPGAEVWLDALTAIDGRRLRLRSYAWLRMEAARFRGDGYHEHLWGERLAVLRAVANEEADLEATRFLRVLIAFDLIRDPLDVAEAARCRRHREEVARGAWLERPSQTLTRGHARKVRNGTGVVLATRLTTPVYSRRRFSRSVQPWRWTSHNCVASSGASLARTKSPGWRTSTSIGAHRCAARWPRSRVKQPSRPKRRPRCQSLFVISPGAERIVLGPTIGEGGMASVRLGLRDESGRTVAVKMIREYEGASEQRLLLEGAADRAAAAPQHHSDP